MWLALNLFHFLNYTDLNFNQWLTMLFEVSSNVQRRLLCCALSSTWHDKNSKVHLKKSQTGTQLAHFVTNYIRELDGLEQKRLICVQSGICWRKSSDSVIKINFDSAFSRLHSKSALALVACNERGDVLISMVVFHDGVATPFTAEVIACYQATLLGVSQGWLKIEIEGNARSIIKKC